MKIQEKTKGFLFVIFGNEKNRGGKEAGDRAHCDEVLSELF